MVIGWLMTRARRGSQLPDSMWCQAQHGNYAVNAEENKHLSGQELLLSPPPPLATSTLHFVFSTPRPSDVFSKLS